MILTLRSVKVAVPMGKVAKNVSFSTCQKMCSCRFAWQAWHFVTFHVCEVQDCREAEVAVPMGKVAKTCLFDVSEDVLMSFCVAVVTLCDIPRV